MNNEETTEMFKIILRYKADLLELSKAILEVAEIQRNTYGSGMDLHLDMITYAEKIKPIVNKANKYIKEVKK